MPMPINLQKMVKCVIKMKEISNNKFINVANTSTRMHCLIGLIQRNLNTSQRVHFIFQQNTKFISAAVTRVIRSQIPWE